MSDFHAFLLTGMGFALAIRLSMPPMRGHPVFKAMHGSAMCCRGCMEKWWKVPRGRPLSVAQKRKAVEFLMAWIGRNMVS